MSCPSCGRPHRVEPGEPNPFVHLVIGYLGCRNIDCGASPEAWRTRTSIAFIVGGVVNVPPRRAMTWGFADRLAAWGRA